MATQILEQDTPEALVARLAEAGRAAQRKLALLSDADKAAGLRAAARALRDAEDEILAANARDLAAGEANGLTKAMLDRLKLDAGRLAGVADAVAQVAGLADPVGQVIDRAERPNGLMLSRVRVPIGLIGIIYESRPNVTADAAALCFRSGNAVLLRGGSEAVNSNRAIHAAMVRGLESVSAPAEAIQLVPTQDRVAVGAMLTAAGLIDMIVPRGGKSLVARVQADARVPILAHLDGICHTYIHAAADPAMAKAIALNAKMRRTGICGATETLLIDGLSQLIMRHALSVPRPAALPADQRRVAHMQARLAEQLEEPLGLSELAAQVGLSPYHATRLFARTVGMPPHAWRNQLRLQRARALLRQGLSVADTAAATGFADQSHFTHSFRRSYGVPPGHWQKAR